MFTYKRNLSKVNKPLLKRASAPNIKTILSLLINYSFKPVSGKISRDINDNLDLLSLAKRALRYIVKRAIKLLLERIIGILVKRTIILLNKRINPDISLVINLLKVEGFYPSGIKTIKRSLPK